MALKELKKKKLSVKETTGQFGDTGVRFKKMGLGWY